MKAPNFHRLWGSGILFVLFTLLSAARPVGLELQDSGNQESGQEPVFTPFDRDLSEEELVAMGAEAFAAVKEIYETELESITVRFGTPEEIGKILFEENLKTVARQFPEGTEQEDIDEAMQEFVEHFDDALLAKYHFGKSEILVNLDLFFTLEEKGFVGFASREVLVALLVHETMHAVLDAHSSLEKLTENIVGTDSGQAINALIEGHAQFHSRRICEAQGWQAAFERFSNAIIWMPPTEDVGEALLMKVVIAQMRFWYEEGEQFFMAVHAARGDEGVRAVLKDPPTESVLISEPDWYLNPETRPKTDFDLKERVGSFVALLEKESMGVIQLSLLRPQVMAAFSLLPEEEVKGALGQMDGNMVVVHQGTDGMVTAGLFSMSSGIASKNFFGLQERLLYAKDEAMKELILETHYEPIKEGDLFGETAVGKYNGVYCVKKLNVGRRVLHASTLIGIRGRVSVEISCVKPGVTYSTEALIMIANLLLDADQPAERPLFPLPTVDGIMLPDSATATPDSTDAYYWRPAVSIRQSGSIWTDYSSSGGHGEAPEGQEVKDNPTELLHGGGDESLFVPSSRNPSKLREFLADASRLMLRQKPDGSPTTQDDPDSLPTGPLLIRADAFSPFESTQKLMEECGRKDIQIWKLQMAISGGEKIHIYLPRDFGIGKFGNPEDSASVEERGRVEVIISVVDEGNRLDEKGEREYDPALDERFIFDDTRELSYQIDSWEYLEHESFAKRLQALHRADEEAVAVINPGSGTVTQDVVDVFDVIIDAGFTQILFMATEED